MLKAGQIGRNVILNWASLGVALLVSFFLAPFVVHQLGNVGYGVWALVNSMIAYMTLLDLGLRGAVTRFVSRDYAQGEHKNAARAVSGAFWLRLWIGLGVVVISLALSLLAVRIFQIPPEMQLAMRWALLATGASVAVSLTFGVFGAVLAALHRFDLLASVTVSQTLVRAVGVVWLLKSGYGIVALAVWELIIVVVASAALVGLALRSYSRLRVQVRRPDSDMLRQLWGYGSFVFLIHIAIQMIYYTDNLVVGGFLSAGAVTFYAIGGRLIEYLRQLVASLAAIFMSLASSFEAQGQGEKLRQLLIQGTRGALLVALPIEVALFFRGQTFIGLWMGPEYAEVSGRVLQILLVAQVFATANHTSSGIAFGLGKHRPVAYGHSAEALVNVFLSIFLVQRIGLEGVAWGTVIPSLALQLLFWPRYVCKMVGVSVRTYLWQSWARVGIATIPFGAACYLTDRYWVPASVLGFFLQIAAILPLFFLGAGLCFWNELRAHAGGWIRAIFGGDSSAPQEISDTGAGE